MDDSDFSEKMACFAGRAASGDFVDASHDCGELPEGQQKLIKSDLWDHSANLEKFIGGLPCVIYQCTEDLTFTYLSPNSIELLGVMAEQLLGNRSFWDDRSNPGDRRKLRARVEGLGAGESASCIHRLVNDLGSSLWVSNSFRKLHTSSGIVVRGSIIRLEYNDCAEKLDAEVVSHFAHKLGNHIQLINLLISSLGRNGISSLDVSQLEHAVNRMVEFTRAFLNYSQGISYQSDVDFGETLTTLIQNIRPSFAAKHVSLNEVVECWGDHAIVHGDPLLLEVALNSLLQNALDATIDGDEVVVEFYNDRSGHEIGRVGQLCIADSGCGIAPDDLDNVCTPFYTTKKDCDGLGLSLAARIVEMHGGVLNISSLVGQGTKVYVRLPLVPTRSTSER